MKIILSPTKKMKENEDILEYQNLPVFLDKANEILLYLKSKTKEELKKIWNCNDSILEENRKRIKNMNLTKSLTPALYSFDGLAFKYMVPLVFDKEALDYIQNNLRILSGFYGVLKPLDGVRAYRLEMMAELDDALNSSLYDFWGKKIYDEVIKNDNIIINLASKEYAKCIEKYLTDDTLYITITFCEKVKDKLITKGTFAKMARGRMVRFMAENKIEDISEIKKFNELGYVYKEELSSKTNFVFERLNHE